MAIAAVDRETEVTYIRRERDWASARRGRGPARRHGADAADAAADDRRPAAGNGHGTATGTATRTAMAPGRRCSTSHE